MRSRILLTGVAVGACVSAAFGQNFNIDIDTTFGTPSSGYGGAAARPGAWANPAVGSTSVRAALTDITGAATSATLANMSAAAVFTFDNPATTGDDQALLDDLLDLGTTGPDVFVFAGLTPGQYDVYTYAWAPDAPTTFITTVEVNGLPGQNVGGADWTGAHVQGVTYAKHTVTIAAGEAITVTTNPTAGSFGSLNGFQLVSVCYPDCNGDGVLTVQDFGCFQTQFVQGTAYADCNGDGVRTVQDFGCFQTKFVQGCP